MDGIVARLFFEPKARERNVNLADVANRLLAGQAEGQSVEGYRAEILGLYGKVLKGEAVSDDEGNRRVGVLKLSGVTCTVGGQLAIRNRIYRKVFDRKWVEANLPDAETRRLRAVAREETKKRKAAEAREAEVRRLLAVNEALRQKSEHELYIAEMNLTQKAYEENNFALVLELLERHRKDPDRGFEWGYWNRLSHQKMLTLTGHTQRITSAAFSPDGNRIVTGSWDSIAKVWDAWTGRELLTLQGHIGWIWSVTYSPDRRRIVTASTDKTAKVWDSATGRELLTLKGHTGEVLSVAFSPDGHGQRILTGSLDQTAKLWEATPPPLTQSQPPAGSRYMLPK